MIKLALTCAAAMALVTCSSDGGQPATSGSNSDGGDRAISVLNAGVRAELGSAKILFDPVYDNHFGTFHEMSEELTERIINGQPPYDNVDAVFISHAHGDHFSVNSILAMLRAQRNLHVVAPAQAVDQLLAANTWDENYNGRITAIALENGQDAQRFTMFGATIEAMRTPHSGWPDRHADTHNITYRITGPSGARVLHLGDAAPSAEHFAPYEPLLSNARTHMAFVPYWTFATANADDFINRTLNAETAVGMHVPVTAPPGLASSGRDFFSDEGQVRAIDGRD